MNLTSGSLMGRWLIVFAAMMHRFGAIRKMILLVACWCSLLLSPYAWSVACDAIFTNGVQSHAGNGSVHLGYMSRINGGSTQLDTPGLTMQSEWQDQAGLCNGVRCTASGQPTASSSPAILTGSYMPATFLTGSGNNGNINVAQGAQLTRAAGDYGTVTIQANNARLSFTSTDATYRMRGLTTNYRSILEMQPGDYWINGNLVLNQETTIRRLNGSDGPVRLYVNGNVSTQKIFIEGFAPGQLEIYATGNVNFGNETDIPGFVYAQGNVFFTQNARVSGGVYAPSFSTGNNMDLTYSEVDANHYLGSFTADHRAVIKMQPGDYWFSGDLILNEVTLERLNGSANPVRIFVSGNIDIRHAAKFTGFGPGQLLIYSAQNININSQQHVPAFIYAARNIDIGFRSGVTGAVAGQRVTIGQESIVTYVVPSNLGSLCTDGALIDRYVFTHAGTGVTCEAEPILVTAIGTDDNPVVPPAGTRVELATDPLTGSWVESNLHVFDGNSSSFIRYLRQTIPAHLILLASDGTVSGESAITFENVGLKFDGLPLLPDSMIAGEVYEGASLRAVKTNSETGACEARVTGVTTVGLGYECRNPSTCSSGQAFLLSGGAATANNSGVTINYSDVPLVFDAAGVANLSLYFTDVGQVRLHGELQLPVQGADPAITLRGSSAEFVVKPHHFDLVHVRNTSNVNSDGTSPFTAAGEQFQVVVQAKNGAGGLTPNFGYEATPEGIALALGDLRYPSSGSRGVLGNAASFTRSTTGTGEFINTAVYWSEVGTIELKAALADGNYLGAGDVVEQPVVAAGRFYPHHFTLRDSSIEDSCSGFSYMDQPAVKLTYELEARSLQDIVTENYHSLRYTPTARVNYVAEDGESGVNVGSRFIVNTTEWDAGVLKVDTNSAVFTRKSHQSLPPPATEVDGPFKNLQIGLFLSGGDSRPLHGLNMNPDTSNDCQASNSCTAIKIGTPRVVRFGRLRLDDAFGPESVHLPVKFATEYWTGNFFAAAETDQCTAIPRQAIRYPAGTIDNDANRTVNLNGGSTQGQYADLQADAVIFNAGNAGHFFSAPGTGTGNFVVDINLADRAWLRYDWNQNGDHSDDTGLRANFGFGQYRGHDRIIYWREVFE